MYIASSTFRKSLNLNGEVAVIFFNELSVLIIVENMSGPVLGIVELGHVYLSYLEKKILRVGKRFKASIMVGEELVSKLNIFDRPSLSDIIFNAILGAKRVC